jgi:polyhydroxybutyrate depolymerase
MKNMFRILLIFSFALLPYFAFAQLKQIKIDGVTRYYRVFIPTSYNQQNKYPLVLNLHGNGSNSLEQQFYSEMDVVADTAGFIVVYPDGINNTWNSGFNSPYTSGVNDVGFIAALLDTLAAQYSIDQQRVYTCGMSMGGFMSARLACELAHRFAAFGTVTGLTSTQLAQRCQSTFTMPMVSFHGTDDNVVAYQGSPAFSGAEANAQWWAGKNGCALSPVINALPDTANDGTLVTTIHYNNCQPESEVLLYKIENGGHTWPGAMDVPSLGVTSRQIHASVELWKFFNKYKTNLDVMHHPIPQADIYPNPFKEKLTLKNLPAGKLQVFDRMGRLAMQEENPSLGNKVVDFSGKTPGVYFVVFSSENYSFSKKVILTGQ